MILGQFNRFLHVGAIGFSIDAGLLWLLVHQLGFDPVVGRAISFLVTITVTFALNARYTFAVHVQVSRMSRYAVIQMLGAILNFGLYTFLVTHGGLEERPLIALSCGSALGSAHNFLMMRRFVFRTNDIRRLAD